MASEKVIAHAAASIAAAQFPLIVLGGGANRPGHAAALSAAIHRLAIPFFNTQIGKGAVDGNSHLFLGTVALSDGDYVHLASRHADLIITVGHDTVEKPPFLMGRGGPQVIHLDFNPADIDQIYFPQQEVIGDIADSLTRIANALDGHPDRDLTYYLKVQALVLKRTSDLETAIRLKLNIVVLVVEDKGYGMIRWKQEAEGFADFGLSFENPDFVAYAKSYGANGVRVRSAESLLPVLEQSFVDGGVQIVMVPIDYSENRRVLVDELKDNLAAMRWNSDGNLMQVVQPFDGEFIQHVLPDVQVTVERKLSLASEAFANRRRWIPAYRRIKLLMRLARLIERERDAFALLIVREGGKPLSDAIIEVTRAINGVEIAAAGIEYLTGAEIPMGLTAASADRLAFSTREPIGVVVAISAFNHPLNLLVHQVAPAIAAGCPVLVKPAMTTPLCCIKVVDLIYEAGLPEPWCQAVILDNNLLVEALATDRRVAFLSFIGSASVGWSLRSKLRRVRDMRSSMEVSLLF